MLDIFLLSFATLFVIIDPIGVASITVSLTAGFDAQSKRRVVLHAALLAFVILLFFGLIGEGFLDAIGIGMPAFQISGGILLFITAIEMLFERRAARRSALSAASDPTVFPLALPLLAGPGAMTSMILLIGQYSGDVLAQSMVFATMAVVIVLAAILGLTFSRFAGLLGDAGVQLVNRILGVLLAALSIQFIADGINAYIQGVF